MKNQNSDKSEYFLKEMIKPNLTNKAFFTALPNFISLFEINLICSVT